MELGVPYKTDNFFISLASTDVRKNCLVLHRSSFFGPQNWTPRLEREERSLTTPFLTDSSNEIITNNVVYTAATFHSLEPTMLFTFLLAE